MLKAELIFPGSSYVTLENFLSTGSNSLPLDWDEPL